jgi:hypothetical protein
MALMQAAATTGNAESSFLHCHRFVPRRAHSRARFTNLRIVSGVKKTHSFGHRANYF